MVFWAGNFIVVKGAVGVLPPVGFTFLRYCLASVTLLALLRWREGSFRLPRGDIVPVFLLGAIGFGCYQMLWTVALQTIPAGDSALLIAATPVMTALLAMAVGADTPNSVKVAGALTSRSWASALVIAAGQGLVLGASLIGDGLTLLAAACWAIYTVFGCRHPAAALAARHIDLGARRRNDLHGSGRHRAARDDGPFGHRTRRALRDLLRRRARGRARERRRPPGRQGPRTDLGDRAAVPGPAARGRHGRGLPVRADPPRARSSVAP